MNETLKVLESRRSCRNFKPDMVKDVFCKTLLEKVAKYKRTTLHVQKGQSCKDLRHAWCR